MVWGHDKSAGEDLVQIPSGQLVRVNPPGSKVLKELLFRDAALSVRKTNVPHNYQLIVTRVYEEGEDELGDSGEDDDELSFLIDEVLSFRRTTVGFKDHTLFWMNPMDDSKQTAYEFLPTSSTTDTTISTVELVVYQCMFERRSGKDHRDASDEEIEAYIKFLKASAASAATKLTRESGKHATASPVTQPANRAISTSKSTAAKTKTQATPATPATPIQKSSAKQPKSVDTPASTTSSSSVYDSPAGEAQQPLTPINQIQ
ncbi:hypothetical protein HK405_000906, partial [Cladochytrium tenue]